MTSQAARVGKGGASSGWAHTPLAHGPPCRPLCAARPPSLCLPTPAWQVIGSLLVIQESAEKLWSGLVAGGHLCCWELGAGRRNHSHVQVGICWEQR